MFHRRALTNIGLLATVLLLTAACTAAPLPGNQPAAAQVKATPVVAILLPTPTPAVEIRLHTPTAAAEISLPTPTPGNAAAGSAQVPDPTTLTLTLAPVVENLSQPLFVTHAGDGSNRLFIVEKTGAIRIVQDGALLAAPFLDLSGSVSSSSEQGLLGLAFPPNFAERGYFFVNYTDRQGDTQVARYQVSNADPNRADPASAYTVLTIDQPAGNHNGGMLAFGPDGMLYIGTGDGGAAVEYSLFCFANSLSRAPIVCATTGMAPAAVCSRSVALR